LGSVSYFFIEERPITDGKKETKTFEGLCDSTFLRNGCWKFSFAITIENIKQILQTLDWCKFI